MVQGSGDTLSTLGLRQPGRLCNFSFKYLFLIKLKSFLLLFFQCDYHNDHHSLFLFSFFLMTDIGTSIVICLFWSCLTSLWRSFADDKFILTESLETFLKAFLALATVTSVLALGGNYWF